MNTGGTETPLRGNLPPMSPAELQAADRAYWEGISSLRNLRQAVRQDSPEMASDLQALIREMEQLDPSRFPGNPALVERLATQVLPSLEQVELMLRREVEDGSGQVRSGLTSPVPPGYAEQVAEYFRKLSENK